MADENLEKRVVELEMKVSYQDDTIEQLNQVVIQMRGELEKAQKHLSVLQSRLPAADGIEIDPNEPPPPHY